jgi:hypothetical protein
LGDFLPGAGLVGSHLKSASDVRPVQGAIRAALVRAAVLHAGDHCAANAAYVADHRSSEGNRRFDGLD